ncbi:TPA: hypothetical protein KDY05_002201 [Vibrio parahaemolyticus]|nr:hypothetical protein [Vibrio parahaemolyticus]
MFKNSNALRSWSSSVALSRFLVQSNLALAIAVVALAYAALSKDETVIVVPPTFTEEITMAGNNASESYKTGWGLFAANMAGNISDRNASFVVDTLRKMFLARDADDYERQLLSQVEALKVRGVRENFTPLDLIYNSQVDTVWVYGDKKTTSTRSGATTTQKWTYEIKIAARNGQPKITHFSQYAGAPNTRKRVVELKQQQVEEKKAAEEENKQAEE